MLALIFEGMFVALGGGVAWATACDVDGDGYPRAAVGCGAVLAPSTDCDDGDVDVNPNMLEVAGDGVDQNCNHADGIQRRLAWTFTDDELPFFPQETTSGAVPRGPDTLTIDATSGAPWWKAAATWTQQRGGLALVIHTAASSTGACTATVATRLAAAPMTTSTATWQGIGAPGTHVWTQGQTFGTIAPAPRVIQSIKLACTSGVGVFNWLVLQDGAYDSVGDPAVWPPAGELLTDWDDMDMPGGGYETAVARAFPLAAHRVDGVWCRSWRQRWRAPRCPCG